MVLSGVAMTSVKRGRTEDASHCAVPRPVMLYGRLLCCKQQCCRADWARHALLCLPVRYSRLLYVMHIAFRRVVECGSVNRA